VVPGVGRVDEDEWKSHSEEYQLDNNEPKMLQRNKILPLLNPQPMPEHPPLPMHNTNNSY